MYELFSTEGSFMDELEFLVVRDNFNVISYQDNTFLKFTVVMLEHEVTHEIITIACDYILDHIK